jgi:hypothetical protein
LQGCQAIFVVKLRAREYINGVDIRSQQSRSSFSAVLKKSELPSGRGGPLAVDVTHMCEHNGARIAQPCKFRQVHRNGCRTRTDDKDAKRSHNGYLGGILTAHSIGPQKQRTTSRTALTRASSRCGAGARGRFSLRL